MADAPAMTKVPSVTKDELKKRGSLLKKVTTKEYADDVSEEDLAAIKKVYDEKSSNPQALALHFEIDPGLLMENQPDDVAAFAKGLFSGLYTLDQDEAAKDRLRQRLQIELKRTSSKLRKSFTNTSAGVSEEDQAVAAKVYTEAKGSHSVIAEKLGVNKALMDCDPPTDAADFARRFFAGNYTPEVEETAKQMLREKLYPEIRQKRPSLKKTTTKEGAELEDEDPDYQLAKKLYPGRNAKEIEAVCATMGLSATHMKADPGESEADFARKLLGGEYTADNNEKVKADLRNILGAAVRERRPSLNKVTTRRLSQVSDEEMTNFGAFYTKKGGNLEAIAAETSMPLEALRANPPANSADFVLKLLTGAYTVDMNEQAKATLRACMRQEMARTMRMLKRTDTKEWDGKANEEDVKLISDAYVQRKGDLKYLASVFSLSIALLEAKPPADAQDFAKHVLLGRYTAA